MRIPIRKSFAALLFVVALVPVALIVGFFVDLDALYVVYDYGRMWLKGLVFLGLGFFGVLLVLYPPFLPFLRLRAGETWRRLGTDRGPLYDGIARLRHLETHADRLSVGRIARQLGDIPLAVENLRRAFELEPEHVAGRYQFALLLIDVGNYPDAAKLLETVVRDDEKHAFGDALFQLGRTLFRIHKDKDALPYIRKHQDLFPGSRQVHLLAARVLAGLGQMEEAREQLRDARSRPGEKERLSPVETLARARARVVMLRKGKPHE